MGAAAIMLVFAIVAGLVYLVRLNAGHMAGAPGPQTTVAVSNVNFRCTLPLVVDGTPALLSFPDGKLTIAGTTQPRGDLSFDYHSGRWLPVTPRAISPDGRFYAYLVNAHPEQQGVDFFSDVHVREVATGRDRVVFRNLGSLAMGEGGGLVGWSESGIYVSTLSAIVANPDLYLIDPSSSAPARRVGPNPPIPPPGGAFLPNADFTWINGGYAWGPGSYWHPSDQTQSRYHTRVLRMDLRTGAVETWYDGGQPMQIVGFDSEGHLVLRLIGAVGGLLVLTGRNQTISMPARANGAFFSDSHGMWIGDGGVLWLYTADGQLLQVATLPKGFFPIPPVPSNAIQKGATSSWIAEWPSRFPQAVAPAGPCH
jgi:hypothetical protein